MQVYSELVAPNAVTHSLSLALTSPTADNLVVAKGSLVQIFTTTTVAAELDAQDHNPVANEPSQREQRFDPEANKDEGHEASFLGGELVRSDRSKHTKLVLVAEIPLAGTVIGLAKVKIERTATGGDGLLLAYKAAKMCLTQWDPKSHALETLSMHYYEKDDLQGAPWEGPFGEHFNFLEADPGSRCAALHFGTRNLAILPFRQGEEDLEMDDWDEDLDGPKPVNTSSGGATTNGDGEGAQVEPPHMPSFVLRLPLLDPTLLHPVHLAFLYEYREPTFGILSSSQAPSVALGQQDTLTYKVFTLDIQQRASTTILSVTGLPRDLERVYPLPGPIGGALLVGQNEIIHVDQSGKTMGVAVNPMTRQVTSFILADQSALKLRLERCQIELLSPETGELLLITNDGQLHLISFQIDGRTVSGISIRPVAKEHGGSLLKTGPTCISRVSKNAVFVGSDASDSVILGWSRKQTQEKKRKRRFMDPELALDDDDLDLDDDDDDDDDLYGDGSINVKSAAASGSSAKSGALQFKLHDTLLSIAPIRDSTVGRPAVPAGSEATELNKGVRADLEIACAVGRGRAGGFAILNREIQPKVIGRFEFPEARGLWTLSVKKSISKQLEPTVNDGDFDGVARFDQYMIVAKLDEDQYETSDVYALTGAGFESIKGTEFESTAGFTIEAGTMGKQMRIVQVLKSEVRIYDGDLGLTQILPMLDEETGAEPRILSASITEMHLLLIREDHSIMLAAMGKDLELEEVEKEGSILSSTKWTAGCLYTDTQRVFQESGSEKDAPAPVMMFLLSAAGALHVWSLADLSKPVFVAEGFTYAPPMLSANYTARRGMAKDTFTELLVADLGDQISTSPYIIARHDSDDITLYEPVKCARDGGSALSQTLELKKCPNPSLAKAPPPPPQKKTDDDDESAVEVQTKLPLRVCSNVGGLSAVFLPGHSPSFILKSSKSTPKVLGLQGLPVRALSTFHTEGCDRGFIYADARGVARVTQLPTDTNLTDLGISVRKVPMDCDVEYTAYHEPTGCYIAGCYTLEAFELPRDDDYHKEWARESLPDGFAPTVRQGVLKLINPQTWTTINTLPLEESETIECMKTLSLEVSEETRERKSLIAVGSALSKGEDLPTRGRVQVFDIVVVIPQPNRPETNRRLKQMAKEDIPRGAVTGVAELGNQGLMLVAQGQKTMVRGLKEDGSLLPVAFLDMGCQIASVRTLARDGLVLLADAFKGVWFAGYTEEPYTFKVLGKSSSRMEVLVADFLPAGEDLSIVAVGRDGELHILEFNPDHPKSLQGHLLLHNTSFSVTPNTPTSTHLLPLTPSSAVPAATTLLLTSPTGHVATLTPLPESSYRRLLSVTNQLLPALAAHGGLNAKAHRLPAEGQQPASVGVDGGAGRVVVDGAVLRRWTELGAAKRAEMAGKGGYDSVGELRAELGGVLGWSGMSYF